MAKKRQEGDKANEPAIQHDIVLPSGRRGWQARLQDSYEGRYAVWEAYAKTYGLHEKLGFESPRKAWDDNPLIQGSVDPRDFGLVKPSAIRYFGKYPEDVPRDSGLVRSAVGPAHEIWADHGKPAPDAEGWDLFTRSDGPMEIERIDCPEAEDGEPVQPPLAGDAEAVDHVLDGAAAGDRVCLLAIYLGGA